MVTVGRHGAWAAYARRQGAKLPLCLGSFHTGLGARLAAFLAGLRPGWRAFVVPPGE